MIDSHMIETRVVLILRPGTKTNARSIFIDKNRLPHYNGCRTIHQIKTRNENMGTIYLIRHGQASFGQANYDALSDKGKHQSRLLGTYLRRLNLSFDLIVTGTLTRHLETEEAFFEGYADNGRLRIPAMRMEAFNEYDSEKIIAAYIGLITAETPSFQADVSQMFQSKRSFQLVFEKIMGRWVEGADHIPGIIKWQDYKATVNDGITRIMAEHGKGRKIAIFTSGGPVGIAVQRALNLSDQDAIRVTWQVVNSSLSRFKCTRDRIMMSTFNEHPHLEEARDKGLVTYR